MTWVAYSLATVVLWAFWGLLGKVALRTVGWVQASLFFGVATIAIYGAILAVRSSEASWSLRDLLVPLATGFVGAAGLASFYLALERGNASVVVPLIGLYPVLTAVLSVLLLHERLAPLQVAGVALAATAVVLIGLGG
jgi:uncharacterized membrane protein